MTGPDPRPPAPAAGSTAIRTRTGYLRWIICGMLFAAATINYVDRQVIGLLKPTLQHDFGWSEIDYANIIFSFQLAYALGYLGAGRFIDAFGTRLGFAVAVCLWSLAAVGHATASSIGSLTAPVMAWAGLGVSTSVAGFLVMRFLLGLGESGSFPASIKTVAEWFPQRERALAVGIFNSGTNVGALVTPLAVPWLTIRYGWPVAFIATGALGFLWMIWWLAFYRPPESHPAISLGELAYIQSEPAEPMVRLRWRDILPHRQAWAYAVGKFLTDPVWWLFLFWIPDFLSRTYGVTIASVGPPIVVIYLLADLGSVGGGWLSSRLLGLGWSVNAARKTAMFVCALGTTPIVFAAHASHMWSAVALVGLAAAAHQGWSANLFTLASDTFPRFAVGSVVGFGGAAGAFGGMLISKLTGYVLQTTGSYFVVFALAGTAYLVALALIHVLAPTLEMAGVRPGATTS